jgi:hypothetical protein
VVHLRHPSSRGGETKGVASDGGLLSRLCLSCSLAFWDAFSVLFLERGSDGSGFTCRSRVSRVDETLRWDGQTVVLV